MKSRARGVLPHDPGVGVADLIYRIGGQGYYIGKPLRDRGIMLGDALADLHQSLLDVARFFGVVQIFG